MEFWKTIYGLARKKHIGLPVIILSLALAGAAYAITPARYISTASMVLTSPPAGGTLTNDPEKQTGLTNPLLQFSDGLRTTTGILILSMNTPEVLAELGIVEGGPTEIVVNDGRTNSELLGISMNGPFIYVEVNSESATVARDVTNRAQRRIRQELNQRQEALGAPLSTYVSVVDVVRPSAPEIALGGRFEMAGGALFAGIVGGMGIAYAVRRAKINRRLRAAGPGPLDLGPLPAPIQDAEPIRAAEPVQELVPGLERAEPLKTPAVVPAARNGDLRTADSRVVVFPATGSSDDDTVVFRALRPDDDTTGPIPVIRYDDGDDRDDDDRDPGARPGRPDGAADRRPGGADGRPSRNSGGETGGTAAPGSGGRPDGAAGRKRGGADGESGGEAGRRPGDTVSRKSGGTAGRERGGESGASGGAEGRRSGGAFGAKPDGTSAGTAGGAFGGEQRGERGGDHGRNEPAE